MMIHEALNDIIFEISLVRFCFYFISCYYLKHILSVAIMTPLVLVWQHKSVICRTPHISRLHLSLADVAIRKHTDTHTHTSTDGKVYSWGQCVRGSLGHGNDQSLNTPKLIEALSAEKIVAVCLHTLSYS